MCEKFHMDRNNEEVCAWAVILETGQNGPIQKGVDIATSLRKVQTSKQIIALVKGDELCSEQLRKELLAEGLFNQVARISQETSDSFDAILDQVDRFLSSFKKLVFLPLQSFVHKNIDNLMEKDNWLESVQENRESNAKQFILKDITLVCRNKGGRSVHQLKNTLSTLFLEGDCSQKSQTNAPFLEQNIPLCFTQERKIPPQSETFKAMERPLHAITLTAPTSSQLSKKMDKFSQFLCQNQAHYSFPNLAYTLNKITQLERNEKEGQGQNYDHHRAILIAKDVDEAVELFNNPKPPSFFECGSQKRRKGKLCFLFTGMGSQFPGMGRALYTFCPVFRLSFDKCSDLLLAHHGINIKSLIWEDSSELGRTLCAPPAIFCVQYSLLQVWTSWGLKPDYVMGHSLGEVGAALAASALNLEDGLKLVAERARLSDQLERGKMVVVKKGLEQVDELLSNFCRSKSKAVVLDYAAVNAPDQTVIAGDAEDALGFAEFCSNFGVKTVVLEATHAFHSRHMDPMLEEYKEVVKSCKGDLKPEGCKYISGCSGRLEDGPLDGEYWAKSSRDTVRFAEGINTAFKEGCTVFLEIGPHPVLCTLAKANCSREELGDKMLVPSIRRGGDDWKTMLGSLAKLWVEVGLEVDWDGFEEYFGRQIVHESDLKE